MRRERWAGREAKVGAGIYGQRLAGKGKCEGAKEKKAAFSPGWHGRGGLADGGGLPGVEETRTRRRRTEPHRDRQGLSLV